MVEPVVIQGRKSYLALASEDIWAVNPHRSSTSGSGAQSHVILPVDSYTCKFVPQRRNADPFTGLRQRKHGKPYRGQVAGQLTSKLYGYHANNNIGSLAQYLLEWGFEDHEDLTPRSKTALWFEGPGIADKEHSGLRVNGATLTGSSDSGSLDLSLDLLGCDELGNSSLVSHPAVPTDYEKLQDFEFWRSSLSINGVSYEIESFQWAVQNNLQAKWGTNFVPYLMYAGARVETFQFQLLKTSDAWDTFRRSTSRNQIETVVLTLLGPHNGTAANTYTQVAITFPLLEYVNHDDAMSNGTIFEQPLQFEVMKPDTSSNGSSMSWSTQA
jgi:hypothetical protein